MAKRPPTSLVAAQLPDLRVISLPNVSQLSDRPGEYKRPSQINRYHLRESRVFSISQRSIVLVVGGVPGSGKSTLAANLMIAIADILDSLQSREGLWSSLKYQVALETLDLATPTADAIASGYGTDAELLRNRKVLWTTDLAQQAVERVSLAAQRQPALIISDLPGKISEITKKLIEPADAAIILSRDYSHEVIHEWRQFFKINNVPVVAELRSVIASNSLITRSDRGKMVFGRINKPDREFAPWDATIETLAALLLFDILPSCFGEK